MPSVSLNIVLNFTAARGTARVAAATLPSGDYDPRKDFYKRLRERTVRQFVEGWNAHQFQEAARRLAVPRKHASATAGPAPALAVERKASEFPRPGRRA